MRIYHTIDEVLADRRQGATLSEIVENILYSPYVLERIETPFDIIQGLHPEDYLNTSTEAWNYLSVNLQIKYSSAYQRWYARYSGHLDIETSYLTQGIEILMMLVPPTSFNRDSYRGRFSTLKKPFWLGKYEVTQRQWETVMGSNPSQNRGSSELPVDCVSWLDIQDFLKKTKTKLPSNNQWLMACRAGTTTRYSFGDDAKLAVAYGWFDSNSDDNSHPVGQKLENAWGLCDMGGNLSEWSDGTYDAGYSRPSRTINGGCYRSEVYGATESYYVYENRRSPTIGFRVLKDFKSL